MKLLFPYLVFPGNCLEALNFYKKNLGGEITLKQTFAEAPMEVPPAYRHRIFNAEFKSDQVCFRASDNLPPYELVQGTNFSLFVTFANQAAQQEIYEKLSKEGKVIMPLEGPFCMVCDPFGIQWMLVYSPDQCP